MKFTCQQHDLSTAINLVSKAISSKTTLPILSGIYFEAIDNSIRIIGNDLNLCIETFMNAEVIEKGSVVIPSRMFIELIKKLPNSIIEIDISENNVISINCDDSSFKLIGLPGNEYPELPFIEDKSIFEIDKELFSNMIRQTSFAISQDESRPILTGALLEIENGHFNMVAIDGFRMAIKSANIKTPLTNKAVVPGRTLNEINKIISQLDTKSDLKIALDEKQVLFMVDKLKVYSRLLAGEFINYTQIIPSEFKSTVKVNTEQFLTCIDRAYLVAKENKNVSVKLEIKDDLIKISSSSEVGSSMERVKINLEGNDLEIGFNPKYLIDALKVIDSEEIYMELINNVSPCIIKPIDHESYTYLVLPCRISK